MKKKIIRGLICGFILIGVLLGITLWPVSSTSRNANEIPEVTQEVIIEETQPQYDLLVCKVYYTEQNTNDKILEQINLCTAAILELQEPNNYNPLAVAEELVRLDKIRNQYFQDFHKLIAEEIRWEERMKEFPTATIVWKFMKEELGWNDYVAAGVMGNLMSETGGRTLDLTWDAYSRPDKKYYGICQWSKKYYPSVYGASLEEQLAFLKGNVKQQMDRWGYKYKKGFGYDDFIALEDPRAAALAFARCYERSAAGGHARRQNNAQRAYKYYTE